MPHEKNPSEVTVKARGRWPDNLHKYVHLTRSQIIHMSNNFSQRQTAYILNMSEASLRRACTTMGMKPWSGKAEGQLECCVKCLLAWRLQEACQKAADDKEAAKKVKLERAMAREQRRKDRATAAKAEQERQKLAEAKQCATDAWTAVQQRAAAEKR
eukprot:1255374-Rhodomonas_salina.1